VRVVFYDERTPLCDEKYEHGAGGFEMNLYFSLGKPTGPEWIMIFDTNFRLPLDMPILLPRAVILTDLVIPRNVAPALGAYIAPAVGR
jgi:hypothetical protein